MGQEHSVENPKLPYRRNQSLTDFQTNLLTQCHDQNQTEICHRKTDSMQVYLQLNQESKKPLLTTSPLKDKTNLTNNIPLQKKIDRNPLIEFKSQQQLPQKKQSTLELIKRMKQRCEDEVSPIQITKLTDKMNSNSNSFISNVSDVKKLVKEESKVLLNEKKIISNNSNNEGSMTFINNQNIQQQNEQNQETNLYEYYLKSQKQKQKQLGIRKNSENQLSVQSLSQIKIQNSNPIIKADTPLQVQQKSNNSVQFFRNQENQCQIAYIPEQYLQTFQQPQQQVIDPISYQIQAQIAQLTQENQELKQKLTQQQIQQMQFQQQLIQCFQSQQSRMDTQPSNESRTPIIINNNIMSQDCLKFKPLFDQTDNQQGVKSLYTSPKGSTHKIKEQKIESQKSLESRISEVNIIVTPKPQTQLMQLQLEQPKQAQSQENQNELDCLKCQQDNLSNGIQDQQLKIYSQQNDRKPIKLDFNFDSENKEVKGKTLAQCFLNRKKTVENQKSPLNEDDDQQWIVKVNKRSKEEQMNLRKQMMDYGRNIRRNQTVKKEKSTSKSQTKESLRSPQPQVNNELMQRLVNGQKAKVNGKEMIALTKKNYENLPEIKQKKQNEQKRLERNEFLKERQSKIKELDSKIKNKLQKKKE